jgi:twitching motility protein PilU
MGFNDLLKMLIEKEGSDLFLTTGAPPSMKAFGRLSPLVDKKMPEGMVKKIAYQIMNEDQIKDFEKRPETNLAIADSDISRFRVNVFKQRGEVAIVARNIKTKIPSAASLSLPPILSDLIMQKTGIILFAGRTGSGKSTSLAPLIDHRNKNSDCHIITIEDPVELIPLYQKSIINQREAGVN